jgi:magnesium chelatase family protein
MDIQIELPAVKISDLTLPAARLRQRERFVKLGMGHLRINAQADGALLEDIAKPDQPGLKLMRDAADAMGLSARGYHRVLRVARTLADLDGRDQIARLHIAEALSYRQKLAAFQAAA